MYQSSSTPAEDPLKLEECHLSGKYILELLMIDFKPRDIITNKSLRNAMVIVTTGNPNIAECQGVCRVQFFGHSANNLFAKCHRENTRQKKALGKQGCLPSA